MSLTEEQIKQIKKQLLEQIEKGFPADKKEFAKKQIQEMNGEQLETFLKENNLAMQNPSETGGKEEQCIFCSIIGGDIPCYKLAENKNAIAILDIRPASNGHILILPKKHISSEKEMPKEAKELAKLLSEKMQRTLKPKKIETKNSNFFGHEIINLIPHYEGESPKPLGTQREEASESKLKEMYDKLKVEPKPKNVKKQASAKKLKKDKPLKFPKRIP